MRKQTRPGGLSPWAYVATGVLGVVAIALKSPTDGRSFGVLILIGAVAIVDCFARFRRPGVNAPKTADAVEAPLQAIAGMFAGAGFIVVGVLAAIGLIHFD